MKATTEEIARSYRDYALQAITRAAEILETIRTGMPWSAKEALAQADAELRANPKRQGPTFSLTAIQNALEKHLQEEGSRDNPTTQLNRMAGGPGLAEAVAVLRQAAPKVAEVIRSEIITQEKALEKLAAANLTQEEIDQLIEEVRRS